MIISFLNAKILFNSLVLVIPSEEEQQKYGFIKASYNKVMKGVSGGYEAPFIESQ